MLDWLNCYHVVSEIRGQDHFKVQLKVNNFFLALFLGFIEIED
jgi:hypothetical protein